MFIGHFYLCLELLSGRWYFHIMEIKDSNGVVLQTGDSVQVIKDLKVGGSSMVLKRGDTIKNILVSEDEEEVECRIGGSTIMLKPEFLKKKK